MDKDFYNIAEELIKFIDKNNQIAIDKKNLILEEKTSKEV